MKRNKRFFDQESDPFADPTDPIAELDSNYLGDGLEDFLDDRSFEGHMREERIEQDLDEWLDEQV